ncbi:NUDIX hydrolase [Nonomuraea sp. NN258]|nr:NUDIX hydrolase [Nonomuraea antri]
MTPAEWYETLPTVHLSAGMLLTDHADRVLLVKPGYRTHWTLPGGGADAGEPPHACALREVAEEVGLTVPLGGLLVVDWLPPAGERVRPMVVFVFDGGVVTDPSRIRLQADEIDDAAFRPWDEIASRVSAATAARVAAAREARATRRTIFLSAAGRPHA